MTVNMTKGQAISLQKNDGGSLTAVRMGLGWQAAPRRGLFGSRTREIDLDASAVLFADKQPVDVVFFRHLVSDEGSVRHTGDNLVGGVGQGGDDERPVAYSSHNSFPGCPSCTGRSRDPTECTGSA